jgi:tetratricopeptide (TPR) repeat protein
LVSAGFPVLLERGHTDPKDGWMGHYSIVDSYDDDRQRVHIPDSLVGNLYLSYEDLMKDWLHFANVYLVIYPIERESDLFGILGGQADELTNLQTTHEQLVATINETSGQDQFFAWYSKGTILTEMGRYAEAAEAYDQAFVIYPNLELKQRPWRLTWYQEGPYRILRGWKIPGYAQFGDQNH